MGSGRTCIEFGTSCASAAVMAVRFVPLNHMTLSWYSESPKLFQACLSKTRLRISPDDCSIISHTRNSNDTLSMGLVPGPRDGEVSSFDLCLGLAYLRFKVLFDRILSFRYRDWFHWVRPELSWHLRYWSIRKFYKDPDRGNMYLGILSTFLFSSGLDMGWAEITWVHI